VLIVIPSFSNSFQSAKNAVNVFIRMQRFAVGALFAVLLFVGGLLTIPYFVPEQEIRAAVARSLVAATGVEPRIEGSIYFTLLPRPAMRFEDIHFEGNKRTDISAGSLQARVKLLPLLFGRVKIASLVFERSHLNIEIGSGGTKILGLPLRSPSIAEESASFPEISIVNGIIDFHAEGSERVDRLTNVEASLAWSGPSLTATGSFRWHDLPSTVTFSIADTAAIGQGARSGFRMKLEAEPLKIGFEGGLGFRKGLQAEGALAIESNSLRTALASMGLQPPTRGGFGPFSLKAQAQLTPASLAISGLAIELDGNRAEGGLTLTLDARRASLQGTLASEVTDFSRYASGFSMTNSDGRDWSREPLDFKGLNDFDLDLRLSSGKVIFRKTEVEKVAMAAAIKGGRFTISVGEGQIFGGALRGTASLGPSDNGTEIKLDANIRNFDAERGFGELIGLRRVEGTGTLTLTLSGAGANVGAIARDLKGSADLSVENGSLNGINIEQALRLMERKPLAALAELRGGRTPFDHFITKLQISQGSANFEQSKIESTVLRVTLSGLASIPRRDLDLRGTASLLRGNTGSDSAFDLPFLVRGSWDDPYIAPDPAALIRRSNTPAPTLNAAKQSPQ
jgi:AsmA protein